MPVTIADAGPYPFVVDTGAERTVISRQLAQTLGLPAGRDVRVTAWQHGNRTAYLQMNLAAAPAQISIKWHDNKDVK